MKFLTLIILIIPLCTFAQNNECIYCVKNPLAVELWTDTCDLTNTFDNELVEQLEVKRQAMDFRSQMTLIQEPSTISAFSNLRLVTFGYQKKPFVLDSDLRIPISLPLKGFNSLLVIPRISIRIFQNDKDFPFGIGDRSLPVRTPSAMPGIIYYKSFPKWWDSNNDQSFFANKYLGFYAFHHSNGQDGSEIDTIHNIGEVNQYNGNFGEEIVLELIFGGQKKFISKGEEKSRSCRDERKIDDNAFGKNLTLRDAKRYELNWKIGIELHPYLASNRVFRDLNNYGRYRLNMKFSYHQMLTKRKFISDGNQWCMISSESSYEKFRHSLNIGYILDNEYFRGNTNDLNAVSLLDASLRLNANYTIYWILEESKHLAIFGQIGYFGSDEYNIYFNDSYFNLRAGLAFHFFKQPETKLISFLN